MNLKVDEYFSKVQKWRSELEALRVICLDCGLTEELKWNIPCYTWHGRNIVGLNGFKEFCSIGFFNGSLLSDPYDILKKPGKHTHAGRYVLFTKVQEINELEPVLKAYIYEAIEIEKAGIKPERIKPSDYPIPAEFRNKLDQFPALKTAFAALTPGRQRAYNLYFSSAKQSKTRGARIEKYIPQILSGKGINDN